MNLYEYLTSGSIYNSLLNPRRFTLHGETGTNMNNKLSDSFNLFMKNEWLKRLIGNEEGFLKSLGATGWRTIVKVDDVFDGGTTNAHGDDGGTDDPHTVFTVTGDVLVAACFGVCNTTLTGATATIELGVAGNTAKLLAQLTGTDLVANDVYTNSFWKVGVSNLCVSSLNSW